MAIQTDEERKELSECATTFKENALVFKDAAKKTKNKKIQDRLESISSSFSVNAKILESYAKSKDPQKDKYQVLFPDLQKDS